MQLAFYEVHGERFGGRFVSVAPGSVAGETLAPNECLWRAAAVLKIHRSLASVTKYIPECR